MLIISTLLLTLIGFSTSIKAQKKVRTFKVSRIIDVPANEIWKIVGEDYGAIANSHPKIIKSNYLNGSLKGGEGAERVCYFNADGSQYLKEKMVNYDPVNMTFVNTVFQAGKFPVDPDYTKAIYKVEDLGNGKSRVSFDMEFRTKPAIMGLLMKNQFKKLIRDYLISVEHLAKTGEKINVENFKKIKKQYS